MIMLSDLEPGDLVVVPAMGKRFVYVGMIEQHPIWPHLSMLIWREVLTARDDSEAQASSHRLGWVRGHWFHDALDRRMLIQHGEVLVQTEEDRQENLAFVLLDGGIGDVGER